MYGYKHYIRVQNGIITHRFSDAFEQPQEGDICVATNAERHYNEPVKNERGQYNRQWIGGNEFPRSQEELDAEWANRPPQPPTVDDKINLSLQSIDYLGARMVERELEVLELKSENELLGNQLVDLDIRLLGGGL